MISICVLRWNRKLNHRHYLAFKRVLNLNKTLFDLYSNIGIFIDKEFFDSKIFTRFSNLVHFVFDIFAINIIVLLRAIIFEIKNWIRDLKGRFKSIESLLFGILLTIYIPKLIFPLHARNMQTKNLPLRRFRVQLDLRYFIINFQK